MSKFPKRLAETIANAKMPPGFAKSEFGRLLSETLTGERNVEDTAKIVVNIINEISKTDLYNGGPKKLGGEK